MKTLQEAFGTMARHLLTQNKRSENDKGCCYRLDTLKCAVGALIADEHYRPSLENKSADNQEVLQTLALSGWDTSDAAVSMYGDVQGIHDCDPPTKWREELRKAARKHNLDASCLSTESLG